MSETEEIRLKRKVKIAVVAAMSLFFVLVVVAVFQFAIRINLSNQERTLAKQNDALAQQIERAENDIAYFRSEQFRRDLLLLYKNLGKNGDKIYV